MKVDDENIITNSLGVVCCYFNPCNYLSRYINFISFYQNITEYTDIKLVVIESYNEDSKYRISKICPDAISIKSSEVYWQKEQLLNIGIEKLYRSGYECIAWLDADILFDNKNWVSNSLDAIRKYKVVQLFKTCIKKLPNGKKRFVSKSTSSFFVGDIPPINNLLQRPGEPGYAYGYHRDIFKTFRLYENAIVGSGDFLNLVGCLYEGPDIRSNIQADRFFNKCNFNFTEDYINWMTNNGVIVKSIGQCNNSIHIEYHGEQTKRYYVSREHILKETNFDPDKDITRLETGLYKLNNIKLKQRINSYFRARDEDAFIGVVNRNITFRNKILRLILNKNPEFDITKSELANLNELEYTEPIKFHTTMPIIPQNTNTAIIASKTTEEFFAIKRIKSDVHLVIDKSRFPQKTTIKSNMQSGSPETYLSFIIKNYERLPRLCIFLSDSIKHQNHTYQKLINNIIKNLDQSDVSLTYVVDSYRNSELDKNIHVKGIIKTTHKAKDHTGSYMTSKHNYINWVTKFIPDEGVTLLKRTQLGKTRNLVMRDGVQLRYNTGNSFLIGGDKIQKREKSFYENLYTRMSQHSNTEESLYISRSWDLIFG